MLTFSTSDGASSGISPDIAGCQNLTYSFITPPLDGSHEFFQYEIDQKRLLLTLDVTPEMAHKTYVFVLQYELGTEIVATSQITLKVNPVISILPSF